MVVGSIDEFSIDESVEIMAQGYEWRTDAIRFSFLGCTDEAAEAISWLALTGQEPESETRKKSQGTRNEEGAWGGGTLSVSAQSGRVDIFLTPIQPPHMPKEPPHLGSLPPIARKLESCIAKLRLPTSARLAIAAQISLSVADGKESIKRLNELTPHANFKENLTDVVCQYNDPKKLRHSGIEFNRIFKWSQTRIQYLQFGIGPDGKQTPMGPGTNSQHLLQLDLDFNTAPNAPVMHREGQLNIIKEMFELLIASGNPEVAS